MRWDEMGWMNEMEHLHVPAVTKETTKDACIFFK